MYYKAQQKALGNGEIYHLAAILVRNKSVIRIGTNSSKTHPRFMRTYKDGTCRSHLHAEMDVLRFARPGDKLYVLRFHSDGNLTMAKPCQFCQEFLDGSGIEKVIYSDWDGELKTMEVS